MSYSTEKSEKVLNLARERGVLHTRDLNDYGIQREYLSRLCKQGRLIRVGRGRYVLPDMEISENYNLALVAKAIPRAVISLLSALRFHDIGTQSPFQVWIAIQNRAASPRIDNPTVRIFRFSGEAFSEGIEEHNVDGVNVKVYNPAKTIADCFKYRNKIGLDVAIEALRDGWQQKKISMDELWKYSKICRVSNVIKPYLESLM
ncbi:MAG: type IV toxin-antitoxin system AbiEi family antitoxin domain-containing protein [Proteobacteria bacterium]|nr:type IV toxin-antitoxin system AbiEi family antitoxin domain-containing protein [Pseudomonadota bacterium]